MSLLTSQGPWIQSYPQKIKGSQAGKRHDQCEALGKIICQRCPERATGERENHVCSLQNNPSDVKRLDYGRRMSKTDKEGMGQEKGQVIGLDH